MLGFPAATEIKKLITKKKVYEHFGAEMSAERRKRFDADIARMTLVNEVSPVSLNLEPGETVQNFFILHVVLKSKDFDPQNISYLSRLFGQRLVMVLEVDQQQQMAVFQTRLYMTDWSEADSLRLPLVGLNLDRVWENIVSQIADVEMEPGRSLDDQLAVAARREKLQREIARLEKQARAERQPKKKFELVQKLNKLRIEEQQL